MKRRRGSDRKKYLLEETKETNNQKQNHVQTTTRETQYTSLITHKLSMKTTK